MTKLEAQGLAIVITNAEQFIDTVTSTGRQLEGLIEDDLAQCYKTKQRQRLQAKIDEISLALKNTAKVAEELKSVVQAKRAWLIESEGEDIFKGVEVSAPKTTSLPV